MRIDHVIWATADLVRVRPGAPALLAVGIGEQELR
jgi:hypothetical protein